LNKYKNIYFFGLVILGFIFVEGIMYSITITPSTILKPFVKSTSPSLSSSDSSIDSLISISLTDIIPLPSSPYLDTSETISLSSEISSQSTISSILSESSYLSESSSILSESSYLSESSSFNSETETASNTQSISKSIEISPSSIFEYRVDEKPECRM